MNVTCPAVVPIPCSSSSPCNSAASPANVGFLYSPFHLSPPSPTGGCASARSLNSSFLQLSHRHRRHISGKKVLVVRARSSALDSDGDRGVSNGRDSWVSDGKVSGVSQKHQDKASWAESREVWSSANPHTSSGSSSVDSSYPNNQQRAFSPSQTLPEDSNLTRNRQTRVINPSAASRLQNRLPAFKQAAEPDAFGASFSPVHGADAFSSFNGQSPSSSVQKSSSFDEGSSRNESVFTSKLEEILNKFRTREKQSSSRDDPYEEGRRNGAAPSALQSDTFHNKEFQATRSRLQANGDWRTSIKDAQNPRNKGPVYDTSGKDNDFNEEERGFSTASAEHHRRGSGRERRLGMGKGNAGLYKTEGAPSNIFGNSTPLPWGEQGVHSPASKIQSPIRKGSSNFAGTRTTKSSQSSVFGNSRRGPNSESRDGHWSTGIDKPSERGKRSKPFSMSQKEHISDAEKPIVSEFDWTDSDEEDSIDIASSITSDDGASSSHSKKADQPSWGQKADQPSSGSSMGAKNGSLESTTKGEIATWHRHSYPDLPFEFQHSYSETPKAQIIRYREEPYSPFGPDTMGRPWTGGPPLSKSKKNQREFDSFKPPPSGKKGIKFVQSPGPFPEGEGPTPARSREAILGDPLTGEEIVELVDKCRSERRQLNLGRDGLTHNMLDLIHCHWKRRRVVKVKSMGVPTVDMDNVCFHLEDKTGGKIIYRTGGVVYLFRGRNYNYKDRPQIPIMLWRPISPVYPRLIKRAPEGLTIEEADKLRLLGQKVEPLCTLAKNGVYLTLVKDVKAAFRIDEIVRIDCRGLNPSDFKKIGAKLRDLVPCVLLSFDDEQILMWKGKTMASADVDADTSNRMEVTNGSEVEAARSSASYGVGPTHLSTVDTAVKVLADDAEDESCSAIEKIKQQALVIDTTGVSTESWECSSISAGRGFRAGSEVDSSPQTVLAADDDIKSDKADLMPEHTKPNDRTFDIMPGHERESYAASDSQFSESNSMTEDQEEEQMVPKTALKLDEYSTKLESSGEIGAGKEGLNDAHVVRVDALWGQAIASGIAIQLDEMDTDSDVIVKKASELDKAVPAMGEYTRKLQNKFRIKRKTTPRPDDDLQIHFAKLEKAKLEKKIKKRAFRLPAVDVPDRGGLPVDELARLLSIK